MSVRDSLYDLVHEHKGGSVALAARMRMAGSTLRSMANPNCDSHDWTLKRFEQAMALTGDVRPLETLCQEFGGVFVRVGRFDGIANSRVLWEAQHLSKEFSDVPVQLSRMLKDGKVTRRELEELRRQVYEMQAAGVGLLRVCEEIHEKHLNVPEDERPG